MKVQLDMYQTLAIAVLVLLLGSYLRKKIKFLERFCIPAPVVGGLLFAIFTCICYVTHILEFSFDDTLKEVCMVFFFTSVGFQANLKVLKKGGKSMVIFLGLVIVLIFIQNGVAVGLSKVIGLDSLIGMCTGSIPMVGGHGTAGAFGPVLEDFNVKGATTICTAAATFGLIFGSLVGGPLGKRLIEKKNLLDTAIPEDDSLLIEDEKKHERHSRMYASAVFLPYIQSLKLEELVIATPDVGGSKRASTFSKYLGVPLVLCNKSREKANEVASMQIIGDVKNKNVVLIDDIVDTAGTITKAANIMLEAGAKSVRAIASHCVMSDPASFRVQESGLTEMVFTDSIPYAKKCAKVKQLSIADMFAETIKRVMNNESISSQYII